MTASIGSTIVLIILTFIAWQGYKKYNGAMLWLGFIPIFSIVHSLMGIYILAIAFRYDSTPENIPLFAKLLSPSYLGVSLLGIPLEIIGFPDNIAYTIAFGLNSILIAILIVLLIQWLQKRKTNKSD